MSWLTGGPAMAKAGALADACRTQSRDVTSHDVTSHDVTGRDLPGGLSTLAPAAGVLSIADTAGAAAGQGHNSLPTGFVTATRTTRTVPGPAALPAVPGPRTLPGPVAGAVAGAAPGGAKALPVVPGGAAALPADAKTLSAPAQAVSAPVRNAVSGTTAIPAPRRAPAAPATDAKTLFPSRSTVPLLAVAPARPGATGTCPQEALRTAPAAKEREHPVTQERPKKSHRRTKPGGEPVDAASRGDSPQGRASSQNPVSQNPASQNSASQNRVSHQPETNKPETHKRGAQKPEAQNQGPQGVTAPLGTSTNSSSQSGASGQKQSTQTFPARDHRHRKAQHPHKQPGNPAPAQAANQAANQAGQTGQAGRPSTGTRNASLPQGERKEAKDKRQRHDGERGRETSAAVRPDTADGRHVPRLQPREHPKAAARRQNDDITAPAALTKATGTRAVTDFAAATGKKLLP
ncbi:hypothetical protein ACQPZZ_03260 [Microbispora sp. CA-135349]|uniref:hypothetical protein n=1 Tax=Microbispora sp. CA-135349 TaxID=3239953 RepID=UPI003D8D6745